MAVFGAGMKPASAALDPEGVSIRAGARKAGEDRKSPVGSKSYERASL